MKYNEFQNMLNTLSLAREQIHTEEMNVSQELFDSVLYVDFPITHNIESFPGREKTLHKLVELLTNDSMVNSHFIPGPSSMESSKAAMGIKLTESYVNRMWRHVKNGVKYGLNQALPLDLALDNISDELELDETSKRHSFILLDISKHLRNIKSNIDREVPPYRIVDYTVKFNNRHEFGLWLCRKFKLFPTKKDYVDHIDRWWNDQAGEQVLRKTTRTFESCRDSVMELADIIYDKILEKK